MYMLLNWKGHFVDSYAMETSVICLCGIRVEMIRVIELNIEEALPSMMLLEVGPMDLRVLAARHGLSQY